MATNRELLKTMNDRELAKWLSDLSAGKIPLTGFCNGFCSYADITGRCTKLDSSGDIDCELTVGDMIFQWLKAKKK